MCNPDSGLIGVDPKALGIAKGLYAYFGQHFPSQPPPHEYEMAKMVQEQIGCDFATAADAVLEARPDEIWVAVAS